jgi:peptide/nickel transport system permease protein
MLTLIVRRVLLIIPNAILLTALLFWSVSALLGSPAGMMLGEDADQQAIAELNARYGFDRPILVQYVDWIGNALQGDFGRSYTTQQSVADAVLPRIPVSLELAGFAILLATLGATILNSIPVARTFLTSFNTGLSVIGITVPNFMLGISLIYFFSVKLGWLPTTGWVDWSEGVGAHLTHLIMPVLTLSAFYFGSFTLVYRAEYKATYRRLFIMVARAKGLSETRVSFKHALPNSILPVITYIGLSLGQLTGGAVVTETVFSIPGVGRLFVLSITGHDFPVMLAIGILIIIGVMLMNLLADVLYTVVNPQIRLD